MQVKGHTVGIKDSLTVLVVMAIFIALQYGDWFRHPDYFTDAWGDAIKNYTAPWYHVKYDSSYSVYQGMNYPFGDHINTVDGQPILSNSWKFLSSLFPGLADHYVAASNLSILASFLLAGLFMFFLFRGFSLPVWLSTTLSVLIVFLSPQTLRVVSHFGLAHAAAIPAALFFLYRFWRKPTFGRSLTVAVVVLFYSLFHLYFLVILGGLIGGFHLVDWLRRPSKESTISFLLRLAIQLALPAALLLSWMALTDPLSGRNPLPYGFFAYRAYPEGIFTSHTLPYFQWIDQHLIDIRNLDFEAWNYVGLVIGIMFFVLLAGLLRAGIKDLPAIPVNLSNRNFLTILFIALLLNMLFAFGLPFIIPGLRGLLDYTGPIKQFRSIGRFAWNCYFGWHLIGWIALYFWTREGPSWRRLILYGALLLTAFEAYTFSRSADVELSPSYPLEDGQQLTDLPIDYGSYQALQTVPHYNVGSGNVWWIPEGYIIHHSLLLGVRTGLPTTSSMLTRTNPAQALQELQLATPPYRMPAILEQLPDDRPLLLMWDKRQEPLSRQSYRHLLDDTRLLYEGERMMLRELPLESFATRLERAYEQVEDAFHPDSSYYRHGDFLSTDSVPNFAFEPFDEGAPTAAYLSNGGHIIESSYGILGPVAVPAMASDSLYICSFWMYLAMPAAGRTHLELQELAAEGGQVLGSTFTQAHQSIQLVDTNGWALVEFPFQRKAERSRFRLIINNEDLRREDLLIDEWLLRPASTDIYQRRTGGIWHNNRWWPDHVNRKTSTFRQTGKNPALPAGRRGI